MSFTIRAHRRCRALSALLAGALLSTLLTIVGVMTAAPAGAVLVDRHAGFGVGSATGWVDTTNFDPFDTGWGNGVDALPGVPRFQEPLGAHLGVGDPATIVVPAIQHRWILWGGMFTSVDVAWSTAQRGYAVQHRFGIAPTYPVLAVGGSGIAGMLENPDGVLRHFWVAPVTAQRVVPGRPATELDVDPTSKDMDTDVAPFVVARTVPLVGPAPRATNNWTWTTGLELDAVARNLKDNCWYLKGSVSPAHFGGATMMSRLPITFRPWVEIPGQIKNENNKCEPSRVQETATGDGIRLVRYTANNVMTETLAPTDQSGWPGSVRVRVFNIGGKTIWEGYPVGSTADDLGTVVEDRKGKLWRVDDSGTASPAGYPDLTSGYGPAAVDLGLTPVQWQKGHLMVSIASGHVLLRQRSSEGGRVRDLGSPWTSKMFGETTAPADLANAPLQVKSNADSLVVTARDTRGVSWQQVVSTGYDLPPLSGWYRAVSPDPGFPAVVSPAPLKAGEVVQSWNLSPMKTGVDQWYTSGGPELIQNSRNHVLLVVKTNQRILTAPLPDTFGAVAQHWYPVTGAGFPTTSDGEPLQVMWNGNRKHQIVLDDADGAVFIVDVNDSAMGACTPGSGGDADCPSGTGWTAWPMTTAAVAGTVPPSSRYGDTTHMWAPPTADYQPLENRWVLTGQAQGGRTVQNTWDPNRSWSGWYACDPNPDCPAIGGYVDYAYRIASTERVLPGGDTATAWTRLVRLTTKRLALEIHLGGVQAGHRDPDPVRAYGKPVDTTLLDTPTPVVNSDGTVTLFAPAYSLGDPELAVAHFDPATNRLSDWAVTNSINPGVGLDHQTLGATTTGTVHPIGTGGDLFNAYTVAYRYGTAHTLRVSGVTVRWNPATRTTTLSTGTTRDLGGEVLSAPALTYDATAGTILIAVNGRNGLYFQTLTADANGNPGTPSGYGGTYQIPTNQGKIDPTISPNISLDETNRPQLTVVSDRANATIGWIPGTNPTLEHGVAINTAWRWDPQPDDLAKTNASVALFTPAAGIRAIITNNTYNNGVDYRDLINWVWGPTTPSNPSAASSSGDVTSSDRTYHDYL